MPIGNIEEFNADIESWQSYRERLDFYFLANDVEDEVKKKALFLSVVGKRTFEISKKLVYPGTLTTKGLKDIFDALEKHFEPSKNEVSSRELFYNRSQNTNECYADFANELRGLAQHCNFEDGKLTLDIMLRDRFIHGMQDTNLKLELTNTRDVTFSSALEKAKLKEQSITELRKLQSEKHIFTSENINKVSHQGQSSSMSFKHCYRCSSTQHLANKCPFRSDKMLQEVYQFVQKGWPVKVTNAELKPYFVKKLELSLHAGCLLYGSRVVIPKALRKQVLSLLHRPHPGISVMKCCARSYVWWPGIDHDIELEVKSCEKCQQVRNLPPKSVQQSWPDTKEPWIRIHIDIAGPIRNQYFLIVVDSFSKWLEVEKLPNITSSSVIQTLRKIFATHGLPKEIVSDNGSQFVSEEIKQFCLVNSIKLKPVAPYHPSSNGQAERMVQDFKKRLNILEEGNIEIKLARLLFAQHTTPTMSSQKTPAELLMGRRLRNHVDSILPGNPEEESSFSNTVNRHFSCEELVYVKNFLRGDRWLKGRIFRRLGPSTYEVTLNNGNIIRRHVDHIRTRMTKDAEEEVCYDFGFLFPENSINSENVNENNEEFNEDQNVQQSESSEGGLEIDRLNGIPVFSGSSEELKGKSREDSVTESHQAKERITQTNPIFLNSKDAPQELRRSSRIRTQPDWLKDYDCFS